MQSVLDKHDKKINVLCLHTQLVILLVTSPEERQRRIEGRGGEKTAEEKQMEKSIKFQERLVHV